MRFFRWLRNLFTRKTSPVVVAPEPTPKEPPKPEPPTVVIPPTEPLPLEPRTNSGSVRAPDFAYLWYNCKIDQSRKPQLERFKYVAVQNMARYKKVTAVTGVPWKLLAALFEREASQNFAKCLHNGDPWDRVTTHVPKGRGPFPDWETSAVDAIRIERDKFPKTWDIVGQLAFSERYNGLGYRKVGGEYSPYVWAATNISDETGKYTSDGKYSSGAKEGQLGIAAMLKVLEEVED